MSATTIGRSFQTFYDNAVKPFKKTASAFTLSASDWQTDSAGNADFPYYLDVTDTAISSSDLVTCLIDETSAAACEICGLYARVQSFDGKIRFRAEQAPSSSITGKYWVNAQI